MKRALIVFLSTFGLGATASLLASGCGGDDCDCRRQEEAYTQPGYEVRGVRAYEENGSTVVSTLNVENGTIDVTRDTLTIEYDHDGVHETVVYDVGPPL